MNERTARWAVAFAMAAVIAVTASLGVWQLRRAAYKQQLAERSQQASQQGPLTLPTDGADIATYIGRQVRLSGQWLADKTVFLDNRTHQGRAGFHVLTPLRVDSSPNSVVLVLRGWIAADPRDRNRLPQLSSASGAVVVEGLAQSGLPAAMQLGRAPENQSANDRLWQSIDLDRYARWSGLPLLPMIVRQTSQADDDLVRDWPQPGRDVDKHRAYAVQWFVMAIGAAAWWLWSWYSSNRRR
jgi:surfeit locus 1 family protein